ncbi:HNH endonuclease [Cobetia amphilecti]|uniref:HNH endonuclease n=1 Tax=Cobetia amphilecti TaxID=1055104 RepID=UPI0026E42E60|nr:HNH endonuclease signature motif containing protein [Cobetia amphilecti]MDO6816412.1 HNH endonuclease signature motif containing protein [Cobetia amphilecti]
MNTNALQAFSAVAGAHSAVTKREATGDKSITVDRSEKDVLVQRIDLGSLKRGGSRTGNTDAEIAFNFYDSATDSFSPVSLVVKYPKSQGAELRLYFKKSVNFYPEEGDVVYIFVREGVATPFIGYCKPAEWTSISDTNSKVLEHVRNHQMDIDDEEYQKLVNSPKPPMEMTATVAGIFNRSPVVANNALRKVGYTCEVDTRHETFVSQATGRPYVEAHHLIPVSKTGDFENGLDVEPNIISLCPTCHRRIHHSSKEDKTQLIDYFFQQRNPELREAGIVISLDQLRSYYGA